MKLKASQNSCINQCKHKQTKTKNIKQKIFMLEMGQCPFSKSIIYSISVIPVK